MPGQIYAHRNVVFHLPGQERRRFDLEIGERRRNGSVEVYLASLGHQLEGDLQVLSVFLRRWGFLVPIRNRRQPRLRLPLAAYEVPPGTNRP